MVVSREQHVKEVIEKIRAMLEELEPTELKQVRGIINGKLGRRTITAEQQAMMQDARKKKHPN